MEPDRDEAIALHRFGVIAEATNEHLTKAERGAVVRGIAERRHLHPDGTERRYSRSSIDRWVRAWRRGGLAALRPTPRADTGVVRAHPELFSEACALRLELPTRSAAQIASILYHRHGINVAERTVREQLRRAGLHREALAAEQKVFGRYEAEHSNDRWITDVLVGPFVPFPKLDASVRAKLFLIVDDHSRLIVDGRFYAHENARACQDLLRNAIELRGLPRVLYADNGAPFANSFLTRTCAVLGIRLVHSAPYSPEGRGKQERANRYIREAFLEEAMHRGIASLEELNDAFSAWVTQVANRRIHAETRQSPIERYEADGPHPGVGEDKLHEAFLWSVTRKVTRVFSGVRAVRHGHRPADSGHAQLCAAVQGPRLSRAIRSRLIWRAAASSSSHRASCSRAQTSVSSVAARRAATASCSAALTAATSAVTSAPML